MMDESLEAFMRGFTCKILKNNNETVSLNEIEEDFKAYQRALDSILQSDLEPISSF